jgi:alanine dehydrogenase
MQVLDMDLALTAVRAAFLAHGEGRVNMPPKRELPVKTGSMKVMYGEIFLPEDHVCGIKWNANFPDNNRRGYPSIMGKLLLNDPDTGLELADMDATYVTNYRTGAAGALTVQCLARPEASRLGLVGAGAQAHTQIAAILKVRPITRITIYSRTFAHAQTMAAEIGARYGIQAQAVETPAQAVKGQDIVVTITPSRAPLVRREWVSPGTHINAFGADGPGKQELDPAILREARVFADDLAQTQLIGEINVPLARGEITLAHVQGTLGEVVAGKKTGRANPEEITVFDATGMAVQDLALGLMIYRRAQERGLGMEKEFFSSRSQAPAWEHQF